MTAIVTGAVTDFILNNSFEKASGSVGAIAIALLIALLIAKEAIRAAGEERGPCRMAILNVAVFPLLLMFAFVIGLRLLALVR